MNKLCNKTGCSLLKQQSDRCEACKFNTPYRNVSLKNVMDGLNDVPIRTIFGTEIDRSKIDYGYLTDKQKEEFWKCGKFEL